MKELIESVSIILSCVALFILTCLLTVNLYLIKKNGFYVNVNCWFCNNWTKVLYQNRNSFDCPVCTQYNGFNEDGDYNKDIPEQRQVRKVNTTSYTDYSNGLCHYCNINQRLKIVQLSQFVPLNEENYDQEIEHFQKQLEKSYKLCKKCDKVLKITLQKQTASLFGHRLRELKKKGVGFLDLNSSSGGISKKDKQNFASKMAHHTLNVFSFLILCNCFIVNTDYIPKNYKTLLPKALLPYMVLVSNFSKIVTNTAKTLVKNNNVALFTEEISFQVNNMKAITAVGFILQLVLSAWENRTWVNINRSLAWTLLALTSWVTLKEYYVYINILQTLCSLYQLYTAIFINRKTILKKIKLKKEQPHLKHTALFDFDDVEEEDVSNSSNNTSCSSNNSCCSHCPQKNKSVKLDNSFTLANSTVCHQSPQNLNTSFHSTYSNLNNSFKSCVSGLNDLHARRNNMDDNISASLENLSLGGFRPKSISPLSFEPKRFFSPQPFSRKTILSPAKFNVTQNSWIAGGFYRNHDGPVPVYSQLSRSSSQSSGFASQNNDQTFTNAFGSPHGSQNGEVDDLSVFSEPAYHFKPISPKPSEQITLNQRNVFYPHLDENKTLFLPNSALTGYGLHESSYDYPGKGKLFKKSTASNINGFNQFSQSVC